MSRTRYQNKSNLRIIQIEFHSVQKRSRSDKKTINFIIIASQFYNRNPTKMFGKKMVRSQKVRPENDYKY